MINVRERKQQQWVFEQFHSKNEIWNQEGFYEKLCSSRKCSFSFFAIFFFLVFIAFNLTLFRLKCMQTEIVAFDSGFPKKKRKENKIEHFVLYSGSDMIVEISLICMGILLRFTVVYCVSVLAGGRAFVLFFVVVCFFFLFWLNIAEILSWILPICISFNNKFYLKSNVSTHSNHFQWNISIFWLCVCVFPADMNLFAFRFSMKKRKFCIFSSAYRICMPIQLRIYIEYN